MKKISLAAILSVLFMFSGSLYAHDRNLGDITFSIKPEGMNTYIAKLIQCGAFGVISLQKEGFLLDHETQLSHSFLTPMFAGYMVCTVKVNDKDGNTKYDQMSNQAWYPGTDWTFTKYYFTLNITPKRIFLKFDKKNWF